MILATLALTVLGQTTASDFFPMTLGTRWTYEATGEGAISYQQEVGYPVDVAERKLSPLVIKMGGKIVQTTFYDVLDSGVYILGHNATKLLDRPIPVFQLGEKETKWSYEGPSPYDDDKSAGLTMKGQAKPIGMKEVLGEKRLCYEVKTETMIGLSAQSASKFVQNSIYAKGVGLYEMEEIATAGKKTSKRKVKLLKMDVPGGNL